jgi:hypothetical protein
MLVSCDRAPTTEGDTSHCQLDVLKPAWVSPKMEIRGFLPEFPWPSLGSLMPSLL